MKRISCSPARLFSMPACLFLLITSPFAQSDGAGKLPVLMERDREIIAVVSQGQEKKVEKTTPLTPLASFEGSWVAKGDGFSSKLTYEWALPGVLLRSRNELRNEAGQLFRQYEGHYAWDPALSKIVFLTLGSDGELHRGEAEWRDGQLWHAATVSGGKITGYRSVLGVVGKELYYRAKYERSATDKDVLGSTPLVYRRLVGAQTSPAQLEITLKHNDQGEQQTRQQLERLLSAYDVSNWIFTRKLIIESGFNVIPHSHPILTLNTRHLKDDDLLLSTFVHEQLHWYLNEKPQETEEAYKELRMMFPKAPVGFPEGGNNEEWTYKHILVCYLEYQAIRELLGELKAKQVMEFWATDHYTWIYKTVLEREREIGSLLRKHKLVPVRRA